MGFTCLAPRGSSHPSTSPPPPTPPSLPRAALSSASLTDHPFATASRLYKKMRGGAGGADAQCPRPRTRRPTPDHPHPVVNPTFTATCAVRLSSLPRPLRQQKRPHKEKNAFSSRVLFFIFSLSSSPIPSAFPRHFPRFCLSVFVCARPADLRTALRTAWCVCVCVCLLVRAAVYGLHSARRVANLPRSLISLPVSLCCFRCVSDFVAAASEARLFDFLQALSRTFFLFSVPRPLLIVPTHPTAILLVEGSQDTLSRPFFALASPPRYLLLPAFFAFLSLPAEAHGWV